MARSPATHEYVAAAVKINFPKLAAEFRDVIGGSIEKKNPGKIVSLLKDLTVFPIDASLLVGCLRLLKLEDKKVARYAHLLARRIIRNGEAEQALGAISMFQSESSSEELPRRVHGLRSLGLTTYKSTNAHGLIDVFLKGLEESAQMQGKKKKKRRQSFFGGKKRDPEEEKGMLQYGLFACARTCGDLVKMGGLPVPDLTSGIKAPNGVAVRHALALLLQAVDMHPLEVSDGLLMYSSSSSRGTLQLQDQQARVYLVRLFRKLAFQDFSERCPQGFDRKPFRTAMEDFLLDPHFSVMGAAIEAVCSDASGFEALSGARSSKGNSALPKVVEKLRAALSSPQSATKHHACRLVVQISEARVRSKAGQDSMTIVDNNELEPLLSAVKEISRSTNDSLRAQALLALIWLTEEENLESFSNVLLKEFRQALMAPVQLGKLLSALASRAQSTPEMGRLLLSAAQLWSHNFPDKCSGVALVKAVQSLLNENLRNSVSLDDVREVVFAPLNVQVSDRSNIQVVTLQRSCLWLLGEQGLNLAGYPHPYCKEQTLPADAMNKIQPIFEHLFHVARFGKLANRLTACHALARLGLKCPDGIRWEVYKMLTTLQSDGVHGGVLTATAPYVAMLARRFDKISMKSRDENWEEDCLKLVNQGQVNKDLGFLLE